MNSMLIFIFITFLSASSLMAQSSLPPQVQADLKITEIETAMSAGDATTALVKIAEYRKLGVKMPPTLLFTEARLANLTKDALRTKDALTEYLALPDARNDKNYANALALYASNEYIVTAENSRIAEENKIKEEKLNQERCINGKKGLEEYPIKKRNGQLSRSESKNYDRIMSISKEWVAKYCT